MNVGDHRLEFLNSLERKESKLLSWGLIDGSFSSDEMDKLCVDYLDENGLWDSYDDEEAFQEELENFLNDQTRQRKLASSNWRGRTRRIPLAVSGYFSAGSRRTFMAERAAAACAPTLCAIEVL